MSLTETIYKLRIDYYYYKLPIVSEKGEAYSNKKLNKKLNLIRIDFK